MTEVIEGAAGGMSGVRERLDLRQAFQLFLKGLKEVWRTLLFSRLVLSLFSLRGGFPWWTADVEFLADLFIGEANAEVRKWIMRANTAIRKAGLIFRFRRCPLAYGRPSFLFETTTCPFAYLLRSRIRNAFRGQIRPGDAFTFLPVLLERTSAFYGMAVYRSTAAQKKERKGKQ